jgi:hypothetical protein
MAEAGTLSGEVTTVDRTSWMDTGNGVKTTPIVENTDTTPANTDAPPASVDTPPVQTDTPPATTDTPPTVDPFEAKWKETFGEVPLETVKEKFTQFDTIKEEYEKSKTIPTYKTEGGKQIDEWLAKGVKLETIARFSNVKPEELQGEQAIKLKMEIENPTWTREIIDAYYNSTYTHQPDELKSDEANALEANLKKGALLSAEAQSKTFLSDYLGKQFNPSGELEAVQKQREESAAKASQFWTGQTSAISNAVKTVRDELKFKVMGEKGEEEVKLPFSYTVPDAELKQLVDYALQGAVNGGIELTEKGVAQVNDYVQGLVWAKHGKNIVHTAVQDALSKQNEAFRKTIHNPTVAQTSAPNVAGTKTAREQAWEAKLNAQ